MKSSIILIFISLFADPTLQSNNENTTNAPIVKHKSSFRVWLHYSLYGDRVGTTDLISAIREWEYNGLIIKLFNAFKCLLASINEIYEMSQTSIKIDYEESRTTTNSSTII